MSCPQVLNGVRPPGSPPFGERRGAGRIARLAEPRERAPDPEIRRQERVGVAKRPHGDVGGGPGPDPPERQEPSLCPSAVGAGIEGDLAASERTSQITQIVAPGRGHG